MPYIPDEALAERARLRPEAAHIAVNVGELTFQLQQIIQQYLIDNYVEGIGRLNYAACAEVLGALAGCKADFIDRVLLPYEACKAAENGDVWDARLIATNR